MFTIKSCILCDIHLKTPMNWNQFTFVTEIRARPTIPPERIEIKTDNKEEDFDCRTLEYQAISWYDQDTVEPLIVTMHECTKMTISPSFEEPPVSIGHLRSIRFEIWHNIRRSTAKSGSRSLGPKRTEPWRWLGHSSTTEESFKSKTREILQTYF